MKSWVATTIGEQWHRPRSMVVRTDRSPDEIVERFRSMNWRVRVRRATLWERLVVLLFCRRNVDEVGLNR